MRSIELWAGSPVEAGRATATSTSADGAEDGAISRDEFAKGREKRIERRIVMRDGSKDGFDLALTAAVSDAVSVPVIASGGVGNLQHLVDGITKGHADAVLAASIFHYGEYTVGQAKEYMAAQGIPVRI